MTRRQAMVGAVFAPFAPIHADSAGYPDGPVRLVSPETSGGVSETIMHALAVGMAPRLGEKLILEARPGGSGNDGTAEVARAVRDGSVLLIAAANNFVINQFVMKMTFDPLTALAPIAKVADVPLVLFTNTEVPAHTLADFIAYAKAHAGKMNYGVPGLGTVNHLMTERLKQVTGVDLTCFPYINSPRAVVALQSNEIQFLPIGLAAIGPRFKEAKLTALAVATAERIPMLPDVPTIAESGLPGFVAPNWLGLAAPAGTPDNILDTLAQAVSEAQSKDVVKERFRSLGMLVPNLTRAQFAASLKAEAELWNDTVQHGKIVVQ